MKRIYFCCWRGFGAAGGMRGKDGPGKDERGETAGGGQFLCHEGDDGSIGGDKVAVTTLIPEGTEPHDFQPTTKSMKDLSRARVLVIQGLGMEPGRKKW